MGLVPAWLAVIASAAIPTVSAAQSAEDIAGVERAARDYLEGFYEGDQAKIRRGVHVDVVKYGFFTARGGGPYSGEPMSFQEMLDYAQSVHDSGNHPAPTAPREVQVLDVMDQTAAARVDAWWGSDYLHLAKYDGRWQIIHVLWQTPPAQPPRNEVAGS